MGKGSLFGSGMITHFCPHCGQRHNSRRKSVGNIIRCACCSRKLTFRKPVSYQIGDFFRLVFTIVVVGAGVLIFGIWMLSGGLRQSGQGSRDSRQTASSAGQSKDPTASSKAVDPTGTKSNDKNVPPSSDSEDKVSNRLIATIKEADEAERERALRIIVRDAKGWRTDNCEKVATELAKIQGDRILISRALCEIIARLQPTPLAKDPERQPQRVALASLEKVNSRLYEVVMEFLTVKYARGGDVAKKFLDLGNDGKAAAPILQQHLSHFAMGNSAGSAVFGTFGAEIMGCVKVLKILAPEEQETQECILGLVHYYATISQRSGGYHPSGSEVDEIVYLLEQLGSFGPAAGQSASDLRFIKFDEDKKIRKAADDALQKVSR
jgi:hypothetical protein